MIHSAAKYAHHFLLHFMQVWGAPRIPKSRFGSRSRLFLCRVPIPETWCPDPSRARGFATPRDRLETRRNDHTELRQYQGPSMRQDCPPWLPLLWLRSWYGQASENLDLGDLDAALSCCFAGNHSYLRVLSSVSPSQCTPWNRWFLPISPAILRDAVLVYKLLIE